MSSLLILILKVTSYYSQEGDDIPVFPFHDCCFYEILSRCFTRFPGSDNLDKDILYNIMAELSEEYCCQLKLDYGNPSPEDEQYWTSNAGEEVT
jgi:hypothetical protein